MFVGVTICGKIVVSSRRSPGMKEHKVEPLTYYSKMTIDKDHIAKASAADIQEHLDAYAKDG